MAISFGHDDRIEGIGPRTEQCDLSVALLHGDEIVFRGLRSMLEIVPGVGSTVCVVSEPELRICIEEFRPDVVVMPCAEIGSVGAGIADTVRALPAKLILLLRSCHHEDIRRASRMAADGFLVESEITVELLTHMIGALHCGQIPASPSLMRGMLAEMQADTDGGRFQRLTPREQAALRLIVDGLSNKQIARRLSISTHGAKRHVANVLAKLNCENRTMAAAMAIRHGLLPDTG